MIHPSIVYEHMEAGVYLQQLLGERQGTLWTLHYRRSNHARTHSY